LRDEVAAEEWRSAPVAERIRHALVSGIADHIEVMIAAMVLAIGVMMIAANPIAAFVEAHPSTKMLALAFLLMVGMALVADGFHFHIERGFIYAAMVFGGAVEALNLLRARRRQKA